MKFKFQPYLDDMSYPLQEYKDLLNLVTQEDITQKDVYTELLKKEERVLDVVNRIATQEKQVAKVAFMKISIADVISKFSYTWTRIFNELFIEKKIEVWFDWFDILFKEDRKIYVGAMFIVIALFVFFVSISSD